MTAMTEITRNGAKSARGLVSIQSRYNQIADESSSTGKKLTAWYEKHNIAIKDQNGQLRSFFEVGKDVSAIWDTLSDNERKYYLNTQAGANQSQNLAALMQNYGTAIDATNTALNSQGSAAQENAKYMDSLEGHLENLKSAFSRFSNALINSNLLKNLIDIGAAILEFGASTGGQTVLKLSLFATGVGLISRAIIKLRSAVKDMSFLEGLKTLWLGSDAAIKKETKATNENTAAKEKNTAAQKRNARAKAGGVTASEGETVASTVSTRQAGTKTVAKDISMIPAPANKAAKSLDKLEQSSSKSTKTLSKLRKSTTAVGKSVANGTPLITKFGGVIGALTTPMGLAATAAVAVGLGIKTHYDNLKQAATQAQDTYTETANKIKSNQGEIEALTSKTETLTDKEKERLSVLIAQTKELENQQAANAQNVVDTYMSQWGDDEGLKTKRASGWVKGMENDLKRYNANYKQFLKATNKEDEKAAKKSYKSYKDSMKKRAEEAQGFLDAIKVKEEAGLTLSDQEKKYKKYAQDALKTYDELKSKADPEALKSMFPDADWVNMSKQELAAYTDQMHKFMEAMQSGEAGTKAFKSLMDGLGDGLEKLGKYNEQTGKYDFSNTNIEDYAKALGVSVDYAEQLLTAQTKNGNINWNIPEAQIKGFNAGVAELNGTLTNTDGKMVQSRSQLEAFAKSMGIPEAAIPQFIQGFTSAGNTLVNFSASAATTIEQLKGLGDASGLTYDAMGNLTSVDLSKLATSVKSLGGSESDLAGLISYLSEIDGMTFEGDWDGMIQGEESAKTAAAELFKELDDLPDDKQINLDADDSASPKVEYAKAVADGYTGTYEAWIKENGAQDVKSKSEYLVAVLNGYKGTYQAWIKETGGETTRQKAVQVRDAIKGIPLNRNISITASIGSAMAKIAQVVQAAKAAKAAKGKRKGEKGGIYWVGDEGSKSNPKPELIQTKQGAYLAGTQGWEQVVLDDNDVVYSNADTKRLLSNRNHKVGVYAPRRASGTPKFLSSDSDSDSVKKAIEAWSNQVSSWEHNVDIGRATQSQYVNWLKSQYKISNKMTEDQYRSAEKTIWDYYEAFEEAALDNYLTSLKYGKLTLDQTLNYIRQSRKAQKITQEKADELEYEAYKNHIEWNIKKFENDEATYADTKKLVLDFYNYQKKYGKMSLDDYYGYLDDLADATQEKELNRLEKLQEREENQQDLAKKYAQLQVDNIEKQIDAIDKQNEAQDKANELAELYNDLAEARSKRVRIYREGVGFVYEQDTKAIKEAQKAISDFEAENAADSLEALKKQWQDILDMFDDQDALADIKKLENALGMTSKELFGDMGTNLKQWTEWYKNTVSTGMGLEDIITQLDALSGWDKITNYLNSEGKVDWNKIKQAIQNNRFASGTTNAKGGFSVVGEKGWELGLLNKGDAIFPHDISKNLMEWGKYSPNQYKFKDTSTGRVETYNFDKLVLPNVSNANEFVNELKKLPNLAIQRSGRR